MAQDVLDYLVETEGNKWPRHLEGKEEFGKASPFFTIKEKLNPKKARSPTTEKPHKNNKSWYDFLGSLVYQ